MDRILNKIVNFINNSDHKIIVGISGHGASGKTTFANQLVKLLAEKCNCCRGNECCVYGFGLI